MKTTPLNLPFTQEIMGSIGGRGGICIYAVVVVRKVEKNTSHGHWLHLYELQRGPRQKTVAVVGKLPGLDKGERIGWEEIARDIGW